MPYNCQLFILRIVTWSYNCLLSIFIRHLKPQNRVQINDYYQTGMITWNNIIVNISREYKKLCNWAEIFYIR